ncbi:MAG TPA: hypothetical protein VN701_01645 [Candidatus Paceibacterota bacterium]|nr:hypothetical protein [Candidatus Paceibacterota bacterium]
MKKSDWTKYLLALVITVAIFGTGFYIASTLDNQRIDDIRSTEQSISIDLLSSETQFELLGNLDCEEIKQNPVLSDQLNALADRLSYAENSLGADNPEVIELKKQYSILEIKDYILVGQISEKCHQSEVTVLYFYSNAGDCSQCKNSGDVLTYLRQNYPGLRVYSFDYNLDLSALKTLITLNKIDGGSLPAFVINGRAPIYGFKNVDDMQALIPELKTLASTTEATSTKTK